MGRNADHHAVAHALAHLGGFHVALADVHALGMALDGDVHIVVDEQRHAVTLAQGVDLHGFVQEIGIAQMLFSQLDAGGTALQGALHLFVQGLLAHPRTVGDGIQQHSVLIALHNWHLLQAVPASCCKWRR